MKKKIIWPAFNLLLASAMLVTLAVGGTTPSYQVAPGTVIAFAGATCPAGSLAADGTSYLRATYPNLYTAIGSANGSADGTHFNVPDYRGRFIRGADGATARDPDAAGRTAMNTGGNTGDNVGSIQGFAMEGHVHNITGYTGGGGSSGTQQVNGGSSVVIQTDGVKSPASTSAETRPLNAYVKYCIKY